MCVCVARIGCGGYDEVSLAVNDIRIIVFGMSIPRMFNCTLLQAAGFVITFLIHTQIFCSSASVFRRTCALCAVY
jgi:hypothetical protein